MGILVLMATDSTPGIASILCRISSSVRATFSGPFICVSGMEIRKVCNSAARANPGFTFVNALNVRIISPEQINSTSASATCTTTNTLRARCCSRLWLSDRPPSRIPVLNCDPACLNTGMLPNNTLASAETTSVNSSTLPSIPISWMRGIPCGAIATNTRNAAYASPNPNKPPMNPSVRLSSINSPAIRPHPAPSAARSANSCRRPSTLTSNKFPTFAHAINSTIPIEPISIHNTLPTSPTTSFFNGRRFGPMCASSNSLTLNPSGA